jgi:PPOX class probable F420-dependent enzyme
MDASALLDFLRAHRVAVVASVAADGAPQAAVVGYAVTDEFELVFDTLGSSRKAGNLRNAPRIALVVGGLDGEEITAQIEGVADEPQGAELERLRQTYFAAYPDGPTRSTWPGLTYFRVRPRWIRLSDFSRNPPLLVEFSTADLQVGR